MLLVLPAPTDSCIVAVTQNIQCQHFFIFLAFMGGHVILNKRFTVLYIHIQRPLTFFSISKVEIWKLCKWMTVLGFDSLSLLKKAFFSLCLCTSHELTSCQCPDIHIHIHIHIQPPNIYHANCISIYLLWKGCFFYPLKAGSSLCMNISLVRRL